MKITKEQEKAIENLMFNFNELDDKPRRLFAALGEFVKAFGKDDYMDIVNQRYIREAQEAFYLGKNLQDVLHQIKWHQKIAVDSLLISEAKYCKEYKKPYSIDYEEGVKDGAKALVKRLMDDLYI